MKFIIALLLFVSGLARAQVPAPPCFPMVNGTHAFSPGIVVGEVGIHVFWFCSLRGAPPQVYGLSCLKESCSSDALHAAHTAILQATAKVTAARDAWAAHVQFDCDAVKTEQTPRGALCREREQVLKSATPSL